MANKIDPRADSYFAPDRAVMLNEYGDGKEVGESSRIEALDKTFKWKRGFQNGWTGNPNDGKSTIIQFLALVKCKVDNWKACLWMPEMMSSHRDKSGKVWINANDIYDELIFMLTGKCPYKHFSEQYGIKQIPIEEHQEALNWIEEHFIVIYPEDRKFKNIIDNFYYQHEVNGCDIFLGDTWKDIDHHEEGRTDNHITKLLREGREFALKSHTVLNWVLHPRSDKEVKDKAGKYKVVDQYMVSGGAAFNQSLDGFFSIYRPFKHENPNDPRVELYTLKQRKQQLVARVGVCDGIEFDWKTNRFYWNGSCPIDGSFKEAHQTGISFDNRYKKKDVPPITESDEPPF